MKKSIAILISVLMVLLVMPSVVLADAAFSGGDGSSGNPYQISTVADVVELAQGAGSEGNYTGTYFILMNDIDFEGGSLMTLAGTNITFFDGTFDGNNKTIKNITSDMNIASAGLFGTIDINGKVKDLSLVNINLTSTIDLADDMQLGVLAGINSGEINNCFVSGQVTSHNTATAELAYAKAGGLVGHQESSGTIQNCVADVTVSVRNDSYHSFAGGLVADNVGSITDSSAHGDVSSDSYGTYGSYGGWAYCGGFVAENLNEIKRCYATGDVSGYSDIGFTYAGGFAGLHKSETLSSNSIISECYAVGDVYGETHGPSWYPLTGGFIGYVIHKIENCFGAGDSTTKVNGIEVELIGGFAGYVKETGLIIGSSAFGSVTSENTGKAGAFAGYHKGSIQNCYYDETKSPGIGEINASATSSEVYAKSYEDLTSQELTSSEVPENGLGWTSADCEYNAGKTWRTVKGATHPIFQNQMFFAQPSVTQTVRQDALYDLKLSASWINEKLSSDSAAYFGYRLSTESEFKYIAAQKDGQNYSAVLEKAETNTQYVFCIVGKNHGQSQNYSFTTGDDQVVKIELASTNVEWIVGDTGSINYTITSSDATNQGVSWSSSDSAVASVDSATGLITAVAQGEAVIKVTADDTTNGTISDSVVVKVVNKNNTSETKVEKIELASTSVEWSVGDTGSIN